MAISSNAPRRLNAWTSEGDHKMSMSSPPHGLEGIEALSDLLVASLTRCRQLGEMETAEHVLNALRTLHGGEDDPWARAAEAGRKD